MKLVFLSVGPTDFTFLNMICGTVKRALIAGNIPFHRSEIEPRTRDAADAFTDLKCSGYVRHVVVEEGKYRNFETIRDEIVNEDGGGRTHRRRMRNVLMTVN